MLNKRKSSIVQGQVVDVCMLNKRKSSIVQGQVVNARMKKYGFCNTSKLNKKFK